MQGAWPGCSVVWQWERMENIFPGNKISVLCHVRELKGWHVEPMCVQTGLSSVEFTKIRSDWKCGRLPQRTVVPIHVVCCSRRYSNSLRCSYSCKPEGAPLRNGIKDIFFHWMGVELKMSCVTPSNNIVCFYDDHRNPR